MQNQTRLAVDSFIQRVAELNQVEPRHVQSKFTAEPSVQQRLETRIQESSEFLQKINFFGVDEQEGEKVGMDVTIPIARTVDTSSNDRETADILEMDGSKYRCEQTNYDTHVSYSRLDQWAKFPDFQVRLTNMIVQAIALNRIMIGFNGISRADNSNPTQNPLLQDVNIGWLQKIREKAPQRWMKEVGEGSSKIQVGDGGTYKNLDALVMDMVSSLIEPWYRDDAKLVAITGRKLLADKYFPLVNAKREPSEMISADMIISQRRIGGLPAVAVPYFPEDAVLVTRLDNLSLYYQIGRQRRSVIDNPKRDRVETYQSSNDAFELEDYGCAALAENIELE